MRKNSINQDFIPSEETIHRCIQVSEQGNMDSIAVKTDDVSNNSLTVEDVTTDLDIQSHSLPVNQKVRHLLFSTSVKEDLNEQLTSLVAQARRHPPGSPQRQKFLTQIIRLTQGKLWKENTPYYQDALQQTWLYFCRNVCDGLTGQAYDSTQGSVINWLDAYLKRRLQDFYLNQNREKATTVSFRVRQSKSGEIGETIDPIDNIPATPQAPPILENLEIWVKTDSDMELRSTHIKGRPDVNCQALILKRLPPEVSWKELSKDFGLSIATLSSFYQRQCLPRLRKYAEIEDLF